ncbi:hypothetical protein [Nocardioides sp. R-C-SC26]|uniref:hypothetical protein n=1 Tax=Nocardioides sp. R-C-SC26 TaxID=2870414 RepID=UPI001E610C56|nr:hypothetical protein [Nocardioides sp. R-C-SC26]
MPAPPSQLPEVWLDIYRGGSFEDAPVDLFDEAGVPLTHAAGWRGRCELRDTALDGDLVVTFAAPGTEGALGELQGLEYGHWVWSLSTADTLTLAATVDSQGYINRTLVGDLEVWHTSTPEDRRKAALVWATIRAEGTLG